MNKTLLMAKQFEIDPRSACLMRITYLCDQIKDLAHQIEHLIEIQQKEPHPTGKSLLEDKITQLWSEQVKYIQEIIYLRKAQIQKPQEDNDAERIRESVAITDLVTVAFTRGTQAMCYSPLRDDGKNPSFSVNTEHNIWFDFVLGEGGDVFDLYMKINNCDFKTAIKELRQCL